MKLNAETFTAIFGEGSSGETAELRAATSDRLFVRSQVQLALANPSATGRVLNAREALASFGLAALIDVAADGRSVIAIDPEEPARTIAARRAHLGFSVPNLARLAGTSPDEVVRAETAGRLTSIHVLQRIAEALSLDEQVLSVKPGAGGDPLLGRRFRDLSGAARLDEEQAGMLSEAAWIIRRQNELEELLNGGMSTLVKAKFSKRSADYAFKASDRGYRLAQRTRRMLGIDADAPIRSVCRLAENELRIPILQGSLGNDVVGATISNNGSRGIVLSSRLNTQVRSLFRRLTIAHELGHLLWDPDDRLLPVQIDKYDEIGSSQGERLEEMRANAFAVAFLAPTEAVRKMNAAATSPSLALLEMVRHFGISAPAARFHLANVCEISLDEIALPKTSKAAQSMWHATEGTALQRAEARDTVPSLRSGRFADLVLQAASAKLISDDTGASWLRCETTHFQDLLKQLPRK